MRNIPPGMKVTLHLSNGTTRTTTRSTDTPEDVEAGLMRFNDLMRQILIREDAIIGVEFNVNNA